MWLNPLQVFSVGFVLPFEKPFFQSEIPEDSSLMAQMASWIYDVGNHFGLNPAPWTKFALEKSGLLDPRTTFNNSIIPFADLVPKWGSIERFWEDMENSGMFGISDIGRAFSQTSIPFEDYYVELELLYMINDVLNSEGPEAAMEYIAQAKEALGYQLKPWGEEMMEAFLDPSADEANLSIRMSQPNGQPYSYQPREDHPLWIEARERYYRKSATTSMIGYLTGFYPKVFSEAEAEILRIRDEINVFKSNINKDMGALMFLPDVSREARYQTSANQRYDTPEGWISNFYASSRYVTLPDDTPARAEERRVLMAEQIHQDSITSAYWESLSALQEWFVESLAEHPIGVDYNTTAAIYDQFFEWQALLESNPLYVTARTHSVSGYKPTTQIEGYLEDKFWRHLRSSKPNPGDPRYGEDGGWALYDEDMELWRLDLPNLAKVAVRSFGLVVMDYLTGGAGLNAEQAQAVLNGQYETFGGVEVDIPNMLTDLVNMVTPEAFEEWSLSQASARSALDAAWKEMVWNPYWAAVEGTRGSARELAEMQYKRLNPHPSDEMLIDWVIQNYPEGQFTPEELEYFLQKSSITYEDRLEAGQETDPRSVMIDRAWELARRVPPAAGDNIENFLAASSVDPDLWDDLWDMQLAGLDAKDPEDMERLQEFVSALENMNLPEPTEAQRLEWEAVTELNDRLYSLAKQKFGEDILDVQTLYFETFDKRPAHIPWKEWDKMKDDFVDNRFPELEEYWDFRETFAKAYPLWAKFYKPALYEVQEPPSDAKSFYSIVGKVMWEDIVNLETNGTALPAAAITRLHNIRERYPYHSELVDTILSLNEGRVTFQ
jgi:hypothetical protein